MTEPTLNEKIEQILAEENAQIEQNSWRGKLKRVWQSNNRKTALKAEICEMLRSISKKGMFTLFLIITFIFMLTLSVL